MRAKPRCSALPDLLNAAVRASASVAALPFSPIPSLDGLKAVSLLSADAILHASATPCDSAAAKAVLRTRQVEALLKKNPFIKGSTPEVREKNALDKFLKVQAHNRISEKRLTFYLKHPSRMRPLIRMILSEAQMDIFRLLGNCPNEEDWDIFDSAKVFSVGVTQGLNRYGKGPVKDTNAYAKVGPEQQFTASRDCLTTFGPRLLGGSYGTHLHDLVRKGQVKLVETDASNISVQPKDASIDRVIATEPLLNGMAQQGLSAMLAGRLRLWGVTLTNQERNRDLARTASERGFRFDGFSTIDLVSASDTVLTVLIKHLLPPLWFDLLDAARTKACLVGKDRLQTAMFSTMGNAFTFPVQCLVFSALTRACIRWCWAGDTRYRVYGDDIICPTTATLLLLEVLRFCGFIPNVTKTFVVGHFRESCGGDWLNGHDVRPVFLKESLNQKTGRYSLFNRLQAKDPGHPVLDLILSSERNPHIGPAIGPKGGEVTHFVAPIHVLRERGMLRWNSSVHAYEVIYTCLVPRSRKRFRSDDKRRLLAAIAGSPGERHDIRDTVTYREGVRVTTTPFVAAPTSPAWYN